MESNHIIPLDMFLSISEQLFDELKISNIHHTDFVVHLASIVVKIENLNASIIDKIQEIGSYLLENKKASSRFGDISFIYSKLIHDGRISSTDSKFLDYFTYLEDFDVDESDYPALAALLQLLKGETKTNALRAFKELVFDQWKTYIDDLVRENDILDDYANEDDFLGAEYALERFIEDGFKSLSIPLSKPEVESIYKSCDLQYLFDEARESFYDSSNYDPDFESSSGAASTSIDEIDDLFERES